jgi:hypothetical protein
MKRPILAAASILARINASFHPEHRALLGMKPLAPHDLRRTAVTLAGDLGFDDA